MVLLGEIRHCVRIRFTFTRPYFGTARRRSKTLAVCRYSGGSSSNPWIWVRPALRSLLRLARRVRISLARLRASIRWVSDRSGAAPACIFGGDEAAGGMRRDITHGSAVEKANGPDFCRISLDLDLSFRRVRAT